MPTPDRKRVDINEHVVDSLSTLQSPVDAQIGPALNSNERTASQRSLENAGLDAARSSSKVRLDPMRTRIEFGDTAHAEVAVKGENSVAREHFLKDLEQWVSSVSEAFHFRVFILEYTSQLLYNFLGPFCIPFLFPLLGSWAALVNRGFVPAKETVPFYVIQMVTFCGLWIALSVFIFARPDDISSTEVKFFATTAFLRQGTIAIKYAYMPTATYLRLKETKFSSQDLSKYLIFTWFQVTPDRARLYAEISFVGVLGSKDQRDKIALKFIPWATTEDELLDLQVRMDVTSRRLILRRTGIVNPKSIRRRAAKQTPSRLKIASPAITSTEHGAPEMSAHLPFAERASIDELWDAHGSSSEIGVSDPLRTDKKLVNNASRGGSISIEDMFHYMVRGLLRSEEAHFPPVMTRVVLLGFTLVNVLLPSVIRLSRGQAFFGESSSSTAFIVGSWIATYIPYSSVVTFILIAVKDMWRRRALCRSCAALLTLEHRYRHGCPAEMDLLPMVDLSDPNTIEAWRKLRQLCWDWGRNFVLRIQALTTLYFVFVVLILADGITSLEIPRYTKLIDVSLPDIALFMSNFFVMYVCLVALVFIGQEVNLSSQRHTAILQRQRLVLASRRHRDAFDALQAGKPVNSTTDVPAQRATELLDILADDIMAENTANPVKLLGIYCGFQLLTGMYFLPAGSIASVTRFCTADETWKRCAMTA